MSPFFDYITTDDRKKSLILNIVAIPSWTRLDGEITNLK